MRLLKAGATALGILLAGGGQAQEAAPPHGIFGQVKDALSGAWRGKKLGEAAKDIYQGGTKYGSAVTSPNRSEEQTREGVAGGLQMVRGGAAIAGTIGRTGGQAAAAMAVPISGGMTVLPDYIGQANKIDRITKLLDRGDIATLEREEVERITHAQRAGEAYRGTLNHLITSPSSSDHKSLWTKLSDYVESTLPKAEAQTKKTPLGGESAAIGSRPNVEEDASAQVGPRSQPEPLAKTDVMAWREVIEGVPGECSIRIDMDDWGASLMSYLSFWVEDGVCHDPSMDTGDTPDMMKITGICDLIYEGRKDGSQILYMFLAGKVDDEEFRVHSYMRTVVPTEGIDTGYQMYEQSQITRCEAG